MILKFDLLPDNSAVSKHFTKLFTETKTNNLQLF